MVKINNLTGGIHEFSSISLEDMKEVSLMDRYDTKYLASVNDLPFILADALPGYRVLEIDHCRIFQYDTLYYDTPDLLLYNFHHCGKGDRYKIRFRNYVESDLSFFEVKHKNNKGRTSKTRVPMPVEFSRSLNARMSDFLSVSTPFVSESLVSSLRVHYRRITLVSTAGKERVTVDVNLRFEHAGRIAAYPGIVIFEVKQEKIRGSEMVNILKKYHIRSGSISKYCLGVISTHDQVKYNRFKPNLHQIQKLNNQYEHSADFNGYRRVPMV